MPIDRAPELLVDLNELRPGEQVRACGASVALTDREGVSVMAESITVAQAVLDEISERYAASRTTGAKRPPGMHSSGGQVSPAEQATA